MSSDLMTGLKTLEEPGGLETVLINAGEIALLCNVKSSAERMELSSGEFASLAVRRFINLAGDEDWANVTSRANDGDDPFAAVVAAILQRAVLDVEEVFS